MSVQPCAERVYHVGSFRDSACSRNGSLEEGGQWWCKQHAPSTRAAKQSEWEAQRDRESKERDLVVEAAKELVGRIRARYPLTEADIHVTYSGQIVLTLTAAHVVLGNKGGEW